MEWNLMTAEFKILSCGVRTRMKLLLLCMLVLQVEAFKKMHRVNTTELFHIVISPRMFGIDANSSSDDKTNVEYRASLEKMPDLPNWIHYRHPPNSEHAYLYGTPPEVGVTNIDIVSLNRKNYETKKRTIALKAADRKRKAKYEVQLKLFDVNVEDMLRSRWNNELLEIFRRALWLPEIYDGENTDDVYLTMLSSTVDMGYRRPHNPRDKEGVIVRIGSHHSFSKHLLAIEDQVKPLRKYSPCPKNYKKTSGHRYFSQRRHYKIDWCEFKLFPIDETVNSEAQNQHPSVPPAIPVYYQDGNNFRPPVAKSHSRDLSVDFILCVIIPVAVITILLIFLTCIMFCNRHKKDQSNQLVTNVELSKYDSVQRACGKLREMAVNREQPNFALPTLSSAGSLPRNVSPPVSQSSSGKSSPRLPAPAIKPSSQRRTSSQLRRPSSLRPIQSSGAGSRRGSAITLR